MQLKSFGYLNYTGEYAKINPFSAKPYIIIITTRKAPSLSTVSETLS